MSGKKLFINFFRSSIQEILNNKSHFLLAFVSLLFIDNFETLYKAFGGNEESLTFFLLTFLSTLFSFIVISKVVLNQKRKNGSDDELKYFVPTFLLYNLYYSFLFLAGLLLLVVPGFYVLFYFSMAPLIAVLSDNVSGNYFLESIRLVKKNVPLVIWTSLFNLFLEFSVLATTPIQDPVLRMISKFLFSIPDAFFTIVITLVSVRVYYYLQGLKLTASEYSQFLKS